jgi:hypothetical protein
MADFFAAILSPPYIFLILGVVFLSAAAVETYTGKAWVRFNGWVYRSKEPKWFWWQIIVVGLGGAALIARFIFEVLQLSNGPN